MTAVKVRLIYFEGSWKIIYTDQNFAERCVWDVSANPFGRESVVEVVLLGRGQRINALLNRYCDLGPVFFS